MSNKDQADMDAEEILSPANPWPPSRIELHGIIAAKLGEREAYWLKLYDDQRMVDATNYSRMISERDEKLAQAQAEIERLKMASRVRPDYELRCDSCGAPHWFDTSIPSEVWNRIAPEGGALCLLCIDDRMQKAGITAEAEFYFCGNALLSKLYKDDEIAAKLGEKDDEIEKLREEIKRLHKVGIGV